MCTQIWQHGRTVWLREVLLAVFLAVMTMVVVTTGSAHAQSGTIQGAVHYFGGAPPDTYHINVDLYTDLNSGSISGVNLSAPGPYTLDSVSAGQYYVCASLDSSTGFHSDNICYDADEDGDPDKITVLSGETVSGIDIALQGPWLPSNSPQAPGGQVDAVAAHPATAGVAYATVSPVGTYDTGNSTVYKTTDGGNTWTSIFMPNRHLYSLAAAGDKVYTGGFNPGGDGESIYISSDSGVTWTSVYSLTTRGVWVDIDVDANDANHALFGGFVYNEDGNGQQAKVLQTVDGGQSWTTLLSVTADNATAVMIHPTTPTLMLAAVRPENNSANSSDTMIYRTVDGGANWTVSATLTDAHVVSLAANTVNPDIVYAGAGGGQFTYGPSQVYRSTDAGQSWTLVNDVGSFVVFEPPSTVYALAEWGEMVVSESDGDPTTWNSVGSAPSSRDLAADLNSVPLALYAGARDDGVYMSTDWGENWQEANDNIESTVRPRDIDVDPGDSEKIFIAAGCGQGWMTGDGGLTWLKVEGACTGAFAINPVDTDIVYNGQYNDSRGAIARSSDGGLTFTRVYEAPFIKPDGSGGDQQIFSLAIAQSDPDVVYAGGANRPADETHHGIIMRTLDDGATWHEAFTRIDTEIEMVAIDPKSADRIYAGGETCGNDGCSGFVIRSTDGGETWQEILATDNTVKSIVVDTHIEDIVYAASRSYVVYKSSDAGDNWSIVRDAPSGNQPSGYLLAEDPHTPNRLYLGGWGYIAESSDGGDTWSNWNSELNSGTPNGEPTALTVGYGMKTQVLYAGFDGLWTYQRSGPLPLELFLPISRVQ